jgi:hypothetical protein
VNENPIGPNSGRRVLDPSERIAEILFGLIMVLSVTGALSVADAGKVEIRSMLIGALGCNVAWGIIDAVLYLMGRLSEVRRGVQIFRVVRGTDVPLAQQTIRDALPPVVASVLQPAEVESLRQRLSELPENTGPTGLQMKDWKGALGVFLLVFLTTFPVAVPFLMTDGVGVALRVSNIIATLMLFLAGFAYGKCIDRNPWLIGLAMVALAIVLVGITMALGG